jgi:hypothetical protein
MSALGIRPRTDFVLFLLMMLLIVFISIWAAIKIRAFIHAFKPSRNVQIAARILFCAAFMTVVTLFDPDCPLLTKLALLVLFGLGIVDCFTDLDSGRKIKFGRHFSLELSLTKMRISGFKRCVILAVMVATWRLSHYYQTAYDDPVVFLLNMILMGAFFDRKPHDKLSVKEKIYPSGATLEV